MFRRHPIFGWFIIVFESRETFWFEWADKKYTTENKNDENHQNYKSMMEKLWTFFCCFGLDPCSYHGSIFLSHRSSAQVDFKTQQLLFFLQFKYDSRLHRTKSTRKFLSRNSKRATETKFTLTHSLTLTHFTQSERRQRWWLNENNNNYNNDLSESYINY